MTALAPVPARPAARRALLRLHRPALLVWTAFVVLTVGELLYVHFSAAPRDRACFSTPGAVCTYFVFTDTNNVVNFLGEVLSYTPCAVAAWAGAALIGRELESGTAKLAWTQSVSPARWLTAKLTAAAVPLLTGGAVLAVAFGRVWGADQDVLVTNWTWDRVFIPRGPLLPALALFALAAGAYAALALRRVLPALTAGLGVTLLVRLYLRELWKPLRDVLPGFWALQSAAAGVLVVLAGVVFAGAYAVLRRQAG
ncbi:hypothetical protein [Streptomyces sp. MMG1121]|uniref:hypothetical protein n=1 Tax=Streptomyces sp. MMG1121 TaxID=1415544 RepID=UPI0006AE47A4|nr:hypothetical protein [Streptomyces sp. MMG1121]KOV66394.1 hypothetical protein ADK64_12805 [Streptomyces sp. MMG1121]